MNNPAVTPYWKIQRLNFYNDQIPKNWEGIICSFLRIMTSESTKTSQQTTNVLPASQLIGWEVKLIIHVLQMSKKKQAIPEHNIIYISTSR